MTDALSRISGLGDEILAINFAATAANVTTLLAGLPSHALHLPTPPLPGRNWQFLARSVPCTGYFANQGTERIGTVIYD
jgi:hypothetical protein